MHSISWDRTKLWTFDDLEQLPDEVARRCEIVDGVLVVSPAEGRRHEVVVARLMIALNDALRPEYLAIGTQNIDLRPSYRIPDLIVISAELSRVDATLTDPADVFLAVEVVSPSSVTTDRITKPAQYAAAGIPAYLRVETDGTIGVTVYELAPGASTYTEMGVWREGETAEVRRPLTLDIAVSDLAP